MKLKAPLLAIVPLLMVFSTFLLCSFPARAQVSFFQPPTFKGSGTVFVADFNGDGKPDLLTSDGTMNLGNGDGTFKQGTSLSSTSVPILAVADFNGDGKPDVLEQGTGTLLVLLGNGDGTFQAPISTASGASLNPVAAVDLNGDNKADVVGVFNNSLYVYVSNGDGTFKTGVPYGSSINGYMALSFGDFNADGRIDVAVSVAGSPTPGQEIVFLGNGDGTLQSPKTSAGVNFTQYVVVGDFNGDGKPDLSISTNSSSPAAVYVLLGNGDGTFQTPALAINGSGPLGVADLNGDGKLDLVLGSPGAAQIYLGNGDGTFSNTINYQLCLPQFTGGTPVAVIATADINSDTKPDIIGCNAVLLGNGNGTFQGWPVGVIPNFPAAAVVGRFDKAAAPGVAVTSGANIYILSNDGTGVLSPIHTYALQQPGQEIVSADFNGDGNLDLVVIGQDQTSYNWSFSVLLGNGDGSFQTPVFYAQSITASSFIGLSVVVADFNNDHKLDLAVGGLSNQTLAIFLGNGDGTFASPVFYFDDDLGPLLVADFNDDGNLDIAAGGPDFSTTPPTTKTAILFGKGDGTFQAAVFPSSLNNFDPSLTADLRNIGKADLISPSQIALGNGDGTFTVLPTLTCPSWSGMVPCGIVAVADLNGDGKPDIFVVQGELQIFQSGIQLGNGDGTFGLPGVQVPTNGYAPIVSIADMNGDGKPDLIFFMWPQAFPGVLNEVGVILNTTTSDFTIAPVSGSPTSQTISAGQTASIKLVFGSIESFSGTASLTCEITPVVTPAPTCTMSSSAVQISTTANPAVTVTVGTTAPTTTSAATSTVLPPGATLAWIFLFAVLAYPVARGGKRLARLVTPALSVALIFCMSCGGSGGTSQHTTPGTPPGTYTTTVTATSGTLSHNVVLKVIVQ